MAVVWRSSRGQKRDFVLAREGCNERIEPFLEFGRDEILSIFGAEDRVDVILGIGMAHVPQAATRRITGLVPRLRRSDHHRTDTQPCRAGLILACGPPGLVSDWHPEMLGICHELGDADLWRAAPPALGSSCGIDSPALLGWADFLYRPGTWLTLWTGHMVDS
jgi:hypothetical protein